MGKDVERARQALARLPEVPTIVESDMTRVDFEPCDVVVILDVLHYVDITAQDRVLERVHSALRPGGRLLLRIGDRSSARGFAASQWVDRVVTAIRGHTVAPTWGRPLEQWQGTLTRLGFAVKAVPKSEGTPFANVLLVGDRR
jgi:SAM-dependent methyltransferase